MLKYITFVALTSCAAPNQTSRPPEDAKAGFSLYESFEIFPPKAEEDAEAVAAERVIYMDRAVRDAHKISFKFDGSIENATGRPLEDGTYKFVLSPDGRLYAASITEDVIKHSSFLAGKPVAFAGLLMVADGKMVSWNNKSGHYVPTEKMSKQFTRYLGEIGISSPSRFITVDEFILDAKIAKRFGSGVAVDSEMKVRSFHYAQLSSRSRWHRGLTKAESIEQLGPRLGGGARAAAFASRRH